MQRTGRKTSLIALAVVTMLASSCASEDSARTSSNSPTTAAAGPSTTLAVPDNPGLKKATIGIILANTGLLSPQSAQIQGGIEIATKIWNDDKQNPQLTLTYCDEGGSPDRALACIDKFAAKKVDLYSGPQFGTTWVATQQTYVDKGYFAVTGTPAAFPPASSNIYNSGTPAPVAVATAFKAFKAKGYKSVGFLSTSDGSAQAAAKSAGDVAKTYGLSLTEAEFDVKGAATSQAQTIVSKNPDVVQVWSTGPGAISALRGLKDAGYTGPVVLNPSNAAAKTYELARDVMPKDLSIIGSPALAPNAVQDSARKKFLDEFVKRYEAKYGKISWIGLGGADIVILLGTAAKHGRTPAEMSAYMQTGAEVPVLTAPLTFNAKSHIGSNSPDALSLVRLVNGTWELADK